MVLAKRQAMMEALFDVISRADERDIKKLLNSVNIYTETFPQSVKSSPPIVKEFFAVIKEACEVELNEQELNEGCPICGTTECVNSGLDKRDVSHPCGVE